MSLDFCRFPWPGSRTVRDRTRSYENRYALPRWAGGRDLGNSIVYVTTHELLPVHGTG